MQYFFLIDDLTGQKTILLPQGDLLVSFSENPENTDYQAYQAWVAEGNTPEPWPPAE